MKFTITMLAGLLVCSSAGSSSGINWVQPIRVETGLIAGVANSRNDVVAFKGIPYAAPPVGNLRWREPQTPVKWEGVRQAAKFGASCPQPIRQGKKNPDEISEDCLFLNVWTPAKSASAKLPVLFYIHGGADTFGSGNMNGESLAGKGLLVVTLNYRLGILAGMGHPQLTAESPHHVCANYGMLDMLAALQWVHANIAAFGGDPDKVTIGGQSSGAHSVHYLTTSPLAKGLFCAAIASSIPCDFLMKPRFIPSLLQKEQAGILFAAAKQAHTLEDLRQIPAMDLIADDPAVDPQVRRKLGGGVTRDGWAFPWDYLDAVARGLVNDVPTLAGLTEDDFGPPAKYLKTTVVDFATSVAREFGENQDSFLTMREDFNALCPPVTTDQEARAMVKLAQREYRLASVFHWARYRAKSASTPVYTYLFEQAGPSERGAYHGSDLAYEFNDLDDHDRPWTEEDRRVAAQVSSYWANFVKTGDPNGERLPDWAPFDSDVPSTMALGAHSGPRQIAASKRLVFYHNMLSK